MVDVDFFVPEHGMAIQVCMDLNSTTSDREIGNLIRLAKSMKDVQRLMVVSRDPEKKTLALDHCEIEIVPAEQFYLSLREMAH